MDKEIMVWIQNGSVVKGEINFRMGTVTFFDRFDNILMKQQGLTFKQLKEIQRQCRKQLAAREHIGFYYV